MQTFHPQPAKPQLSLCVALALMSTVALTPARAQQVRGVVLDSVSGAAVEGAVVSMLDSAGTMVTRTITDDAGRFTLTAPAGRASLWAIRLGFRPRTIPLGDSPTARQAPINVRMQSLPALLTSVQISDRSICPGSEDRSGALDLWEQARAGLLAAVVVRQTRPATMDVLNFTTDEDPQSHLVIHQRTSHTLGATRRPFVAAQQASGFATKGYMHADASGLTFYAPDADVLLDEDFARTHCFRVTRDDKSHAGQVGLAFEPAPGKHPDGFVDVRGTLWLESAHPALHALEFSYTGLPRVYNDAGTGGSLSFRTMPNGIVYIDQWSMLLPSIQAQQADKPELNGATTWPPKENRLQYATVTQLRMIGGVVLSARWPDGTHADTALGAVSGVVHDASGRPLDGATVRLDGTDTEARSDSMGRFVMSPVVPGRYGLAAVDSTFAPFINPSSTTRTVTVGADTLFIPAMEIPDQRSTVAQLCQRANATGAPRMAILVTVTGPLVPFAPGVAVQASNAPNTFPVPGSAKADSSAVAPGTNGRFMICEAPSTPTLYLRLTRGDSILADTSVQIREPTAQRVRWSVAAEPTSHPQTGSLAGYVRVGSTSTPIADALVEIPSLDRSTNTEADGSFVLPGVPAGRYAIDVRRLGFTVVGDTVTVVGGQTLHRNFQMQHR